MNLLKSLTTAEKKKIREAVIVELEKYHIITTTVLDERKAKITTSSEPRYHGPTNQTSDQTAAAAVYNVHEQRKRAAFCEKMERAINNLRDNEKFLIKERYTSLESQYMTDYKMCCFMFDPPISTPTYNKIRDGAMLKIALHLGLDCGFDLMSKMP